MRSCKFDAGDALLCLNVGTAVKVTPEVVERVEDQPAAAGCEQRSKDVKGGAGGGAAGCPPPGETRTGPAAERDGSAKE